MTKKETREWLEERVGKPASCFYHNKLRNGIIIEVMQGPVYQQKRNKDFKFVNMPNGDVYILWKEKGSGPKTYKWSRVVDFILGHRHLEPTAEELVQHQARMKALSAEQLANRIESTNNREIVVQRMRPTLLGGQDENQEG